MNMRVLELCHEPLHGGMTWVHADCAERAEYLVLRLKSITQRRLLELKRILSEARTGRSFCRSG
jgi:hypothetical protein